MKIDLKLVGLGDLIRKLETLPRELQRNGIKRAVRPGATILARAYRQNLQRTIGPDARGQLVKSVGRRERPYKGMFLILVGTKWPEGAHSHLYEYGTKPRMTKDGKSTGTMPATPALRSAFDANRSRILASLKERLSQFIIREGNRRG